MRVALAAVLILSLPARAVHAQDADAGPDPSPAPPPPPPAAPDLRADPDFLDLSDQVDELRDEHATLADDVDRLLPLQSRFSGYLDVGFFVAGGNGAGVRADSAHLHFPEYDGDLSGAWVLMGDPLATAVNSRGDPADTGDSRAFAFDAVDSGGAPTFMVNTLSLTTSWDVGPRWALLGRAEFLPRPRDVSDAGAANVGDYVDIPLAYARYDHSTSTHRLRFYAGKLDSVLGIEYRSQEAPLRLTITPSLICRYTCGHPIGLEARYRSLVAGPVASLALTNGNHFIDEAPVHDELDSNAGKTIAARVGWRFDIGRGLEIGASGAIGAQDDQPDDGLLQWHTGVDVHLDWERLMLDAELVQGRAPGATGEDGTPCGAAACMHYKGGYLLGGWSLSNRVIAYSRLDWRTATHRDGGNFLYVSESLRVTVGARVRLATIAYAKLEYLANRELGRVPDFADDVFTTSLVLEY